MSKVQIRVKGITEAKRQEDIYLLMMEEVNGERLLPIIVGKPEAQAIIIALEKVEVKRPMTHDLMITLAAECKAKLSYIHIYRLEKEIFSAYLVFIQDERRICIDSRASDAIALAVRTSAPIYVEEEILESFKKRIIIRHTDDAPLSVLSVEELNERLEKAISEERYELAAEIKEELERRVNAED